MNYVKSFNLFGVDAQQIPCITGRGAPTTTTQGAVGCLYMDEDNASVYKCVSIKDNLCVWEPLNQAYDGTIKNTASGELISLSDSAEAPLQSLKIFGSAKQTIIYGYQMFNESIVEYSTMVFNDDGTMSTIADGDSNFIVIAEEALNSWEEGTYYITIERVDGYEFSEDECGMSYVCYDADGGGYIDVRSETISAGVKHKSKIEIKGTDRAENYINPGHIPFGTTLKVMLSKEADADWEPYTGGEILPKPVIEKVVGTGATGSITGHFIGSNLCPDAPLIKEVTYYDNYGDSCGVFGYVIDDVPAGEYTVSFKGWENVQAGDTLCFILASNSLVVNYESSEYDSPETYIIDGGPSDMRTGATFINIPENRKIIVSLGDNPESAKDLLERIELQVRLTIPADLEDTTNPTFIPYTGKDVTFPISKELLALPELGAYDYIDTKRDVRVEKIVKLVLTGEESVDGGWYDDDTNTVCYYIYEEFGMNLWFHSIYSNNKVSVLCDDYKGVSYNDGTNREGLPSIYRDYMYIYICDPKYSTWQDWKAHLKQRYAEGNPVTIYLALRAGTETPLTEEEKQAVQNAQTYYPSTTIYTDDGTELEVEYVADSKMYIDNKFAELQANILSIVK